jgi:putative membrane protein
MLMMGVALALAPAGAYAQSVNAHTAMSTPDVDFVNNAAFGGVAEVQAGQLAIRLGSGDIKAIGRQMVADHTLLNTKLASAAKAKGMDLPAELDETHAATIQDLAGSEGRAFDVKYLTSQVADHQKTIAVFREEADHGGDPDLKALAGQALPTLQQHLQMIQAANKAS